MLWLAVYGLVAGILMKILDDHSEKKNKKCVLSVILALLVGGLLAYTISFQDAIAPLIIGVVLGNIAANKVDRFEHIIAVSVPIIYEVYILLSGGSIEILPAFMFALVALLDEIMHDNYEGVFSHRVLTPLLSILYIQINVAYAVYMIPFDLGYTISEMFNKRLN